VFIAASTECFPELSLVDSIGRLRDLEFAAVVISIREDREQLKPSFVAENVERAIGACRDTHRLNVAGYSLQFNSTGEELYREFEACCRLAKATKVASLTVRSAELGTPFNEEVEHLRRLVAIATVEGAKVSILTRIGRLSQDPDTVLVLCDNVKGLGTTLDPSHYICGPHAGRGYDQILKYVYHVELRDSTKDELQVRVGQGELEYSRLVNQLRRVGYNRAMAVNMTPIEGTDHNSEMRKFRLLLESLL
jgi:sugar phosphate isomerase/epimerase